MTSESSKRWLFSPNLCAAAIAGMDSDSISGEAERVLFVLGDAISKINHRINEAHERGSDYYFENVVDGECPVIEDILGTAFIVCQGCITRMISAVVDLAWQVRQKGQHLSVSTKRSKLMQIGGGPLSPSGIFPVQAIDAFANYFKHKSEWRAGWDQLDKIDDPQQRKNADVVWKLGARHGRSGNMRAGAEALGNAEYHEVWGMLQLVEQWRVAVRSACVRDLKAKGLLASDFR